MLAVTDEAASVIRHLMTSSTSQAAGIRIAAGRSGDAMHLSIVPEPLVGDAVVNAAGGARVFVDRNAVQMLDNQALDVQTDGAGQFKFALMPTRQ
jgi:Fe-S cluster assembly iron-binding protein IscA